MIVEFLKSQIPLLLSLATILFFVPIEIFWPRIAKPQSWRQRVPTIVAIGMTSVALSFLFMILLQAPLIQFLNQFKLLSIAKLPLQPSIVFLIAFLIIDFLTYLFHWMSHTIKFLWRIHAIHHSDHHVTAISGHLHHPLETLATYSFLMTFYVVLGIPIVVVAAYSFVSAIHNAFSHADIALPQSIDRWLRYVVVTPDMHRVHHSIYISEGNSNFGQIFPFWDRIFGTYIAHPSAGVRKIQMGLPPSESSPEFGLLKLLALPFAKRKMPS